LIRANTTQIEEIVTMLEDKVLTQGEAAAFLHVEPRTLETWRRKESGPAFIRYSNRCVRYRLEDLRAWLTARAVDTARGENAQR
jgi:Helix-turn-helix domain